jgi:hypothetical protein
MRSSKLGAKVLGIDKIPGFKVYFLSLEMKTITKPHITSVTFKLENVLKALGTDLEL